MRRLGIETVFRLAGILAFGLAATLLCYTLLVARADWLSKQRTRESIIAAIHLLPDNSSFYRDWAEIQPSDRVIALRQAAIVNPLNPFIRIDLGLTAEKAGNLAEAQANLIKAVALGHTGGPRGVLAEYYFRHHLTDEFWPVAREAIAHSYYDLPKLFDDCWSLSSDPSLILDRAIPNQAPALIAYLDFLVSRNRLEAAKPVSKRIMIETTQTDAAKSMLNYCERLTVSGDSSQAVLIWNWLCRRKLLPYEALDPAAGYSLTNGGFTLPPLSTGFDWRPSPNGGLYIEEAKQPAALKLTFTGDQPETCEILSQFVPLQPGRKYRLAVEYNMSDIDEVSGLTWRLLVAPDGTDILNNSAMLRGGNGERRFSAPFAAPENAGIAKLVLLYGRVKGHVRISGSAEIRRVSLTFDPK